MPLIPKFTRLFRPAKLEKRLSPENPSVPLDSPDLWMDVYGGASDAGLNITPRVALTYAYVWQAVNLLSSDLAKLPICIRQQSPDGSEQDIEHPASYLLRRKPSEHVTAGIFKQTLTAHALLWGNGYAWISRDGAARPIELLILGPDRTQAVRGPNGSLFYVTRIGSQQRTLRADEVLHVRGLGFDGLQGYSVVELAKQSLGLGLAAEKFGNKFFARGATSSGVITHPGKLKQVAAENLLRTFEKEHQGLEQSHRTILLEEGVKFQQLTIPPESAQFLETRAFQRVEVASWFNMPPHKLGDASRTSYNSLEQENRSYLESTLDPWLMRWEEECWDKLLTEEEKRGDTHHVEFDRTELLRTDLKTRYEAYAIARQNGWKSVNDIRRAEKEPPIGPQGDVYLSPLNMTPAADAARAMLRDTLGRMVRRIAATARRGGKPPTEMLAEYEPVFREAIAPALRVVNAAGIAASVDDVTRRHLDRCRQDLQDSPDVDAMASRWEKQLADSLADEIMGR